MKLSHVRDNTSAPSIKDDVLSLPSPSADKGHGKRVPALMKAPLLSPHADDQLPSSVGKRIRSLSMDSTEAEGQVHHTYHTKSAVELPQVQTIAERKKQRDTVAARVAQNRQISLKKINQARSHTKDKGEKLMAAALRNRKHYLISMGSGEMKEFGELTNRVIQGSRTAFDNAVGTKYNLHMVLSSQIRRKKKTIRDSMEQIVRAENHEGHYKLKDYDHLGPLETKINLWLAKDHAKEGVCSGYCYLPITRAARFLKIPKTYETLRHHAVKRIGARVTLLPRH
jgi:hypothetical protein